MEFAYLRCAGLALTYEVVFKLAFTVVFKLTFTVLLELLLMPITTRDICLNSRYTAIIVII